MDAILAAGGEVKPDDPLYVLTQGRPKALLPVAGRPMAQWVLDALAASPKIGRIVVLGLTPEQGLTGGDKLIDYIPSAGGLVENARAGLARVAQLNPAAKHAVWASADVPAVRPEHINWLIETCSQTDHEFYYNVIERSLMEKRYPASRRTYTHLKDVVVCGGDVNVLATHLASADNPLWTKITLARKSVFRQAALIGFDTLLWLALRRLTLEQAEKIASQRMGLRGRALRCPYAEIGMDIDKPFQYDILAKELSSGG